ncbi:MAG: hypothetical protein ABL997_19885, partial [Planctomycetota bacterium]
MMRSVLSLSLLALLSAALSAQRVTVTLPCSEDATLYQDATGQLTNDAGQNLFLGKNGFGEIRRSLLK